MQTGTSAMIRLARSLDAFGTPGFADIFKNEVEQLDVGLLPLQQGLSATSHVTDSPRTLRIIRVVEAEDCIQVQAGIWYSGIIAGCSCADDPSPIDEQPEYCEVQFDINKKTGNVSATLLADE